MEKNSGDNAKKRALYLLGYRAYAEKELLEKLKENYSESAAIEAIEYVKSYGYIDDSIYAQKLAKTLIRTKKYGISKAKWEMRRKGLSEETVEEALSEYGGDEMREEVKKLLNTKYNSRLSAIKTAEEEGEKESVIKEKKKLYDALYRRGYSWDDIKACAEEAMAEFEI